LGTTPNPSVAGRLSGMIFLSPIIYATMRDTKHESAVHRHA
jgi:hypothetical protein